MPVIAQEIETLCNALYPIHRAQTGEGVRKSLQILQDFGLPLQQFEIPSGEQVFDWTVPQEWKIKDAYIADTHDNRIVDYHDSNLHVVNGSVPVNSYFSFEELRPHLHSLPLLPRQIPYRTAFFQNTWGFCVTQRQIQELKEHTGKLQVVVKSRYFAGSLTYGEVLVPGQSEKTVLIWTHTCHPSLANDNVSGMACAAWLAKRMLGQQHRYSYRFVFAPATIGAIVWLARNYDALSQIQFGLVLSLLGDDSKFTFKKTRSGETLIDRCIDYLVDSGELAGQVRDFEPFGYDERQFNSPGINVPMARMTRKPNGEFTQYHTSADNLGFISHRRIIESADAIEQLIETAESNCRPVNLRPHGEPQLGKYDLYAAYGDREANKDLHEAVMWTLNLADGGHDVLEIARRSGLSVANIVQSIDVLKQHNLIDIHD